ncbi:MAG: hypothetical protein PHN44_01270 [Candidatus Marinimicrobia bacterium]|nr:hypothetical protein [Candidatus Neomarinimicrobiota bacterium]MDD5539075.1 hypothetical protein [Candidatus Neomarinimicrobiota bacterium]
MSGEIKILTLSHATLYWYIWQTWPDTPKNRKYCDWLEKEYPGQFRFEMPANIP